MKTLLMLSAVLISSLFSSCKTTENAVNDNPNSYFEKGRYDFYMYDSTGSMILSGVMEVKDYASDGKISGTYTLTSVIDKDFPALGTLDGEFGGDVNAKEKKIFINTNPRIADANIFWYLDIKKYSLDGTWKYSVFRNTMNIHGTVKAYKKYN